MERKEERVIPKCRYCGLILLPKEIKNGHCINCDREYFKKSTHEFLKVVGAK
jgi:methionyl-tRNA synthetase